MTDDRGGKRVTSIVLWIVISAIVTFGLVALLVSVMERKQEA